MATRRTAKSKSKPKAKRVGTLALTGDCDLARVATLQSQLQAVLARATPVTLDATKLTSIDTASLQLLAAFVRERQTKGRTVVWQGTPQCCVEAVRRLGLTDILAVADA